MKRYIVLTTTILLITTAHAQQKDWQWIKRGGAKIEGHDMEQVYDIATDSDRNVYVVSTIGVYDLDIDGHPKTYYGTPGGSTGEYALASFACDGSYRWSKIIGGRGREIAPYIEMDGNDNIYLAGMFGSCNSQTQGGPPRIEDDIILPGQTNTSCSLLFISKFDQNGNLLWFKRPMPQTTNSDDAYDGYSYNTAVDSSGNIYWLVLLPPGTYCNGAFVNTMQGRNYFILKYGPAGNFIQATYLDMQLQPYSGREFQMHRNPYNGHFYLTGRRALNYSATFGGQNVTGSMYLASFDGQGNFQWMRQNTYGANFGSKIYGVDFDNQNNIYLGLKFLGFGDDSFLGFSIPEQLIPGTVMKTNPMATNILWVSYNNKPTAPDGDIILHGSTLSFTSSGKDPDFSWGNQTLSITNDGSVEVLLASFDKNTGNCTNLDFIPGNPGHTDYGTSLGVDINSDLLVGGLFGHTLYDTNGNPTVNPVPSNPDFFIAKYAASPCPPLATEEIGKTGVKAWPNPVGEKIFLSGIKANTYRLYDLNGRLVQAGKLTQNQESIDVKNLAPGVYLLKLENQAGEVKTLKLLKE